MTRPLEWAALGTALGCGLMAGVFFAFSSFVMPALRRLPAAQGIAAMQSINKLAVTPAFMAALFGTALACVGLAIWAVVAWGQNAAPWVLAGSALYLAGAIVVTIAANVPLNDALMTLRPDDTVAAGDWAGYLSRWTAWNHVRAASSLAAAGLLTVALRLG
ncbi:MAG TPA: anthrone oxygenase family protein [Streptosporangiaceae bacterium]|nr:anthrone oxygenase family protein [Streptosporangiaceae bacterium]